MKDYTLLQKWTPTTHSEFLDLFHDLDNNENMTHWGLFNSLEELVNELEYQGFEFNELIQLTNNRYGNVLEIIEYDSTFYGFIGAN